MFKVAKYGNFMKKSRLEMYLSEYLISRCCGKTLMSSGNTIREANSNEYKQRLLFFYFIFFSAKPPLNDTLSVSATYKCLHSKR